MPFMAADNATRDYPPTLWFHGTVATDVPFEQAENGRSLLAGDQRIPNCCVACKLAPTTWSRPGPAQTHCFFTNSP